MSLSKTSVGMAQITGQVLAGKGIELTVVPNTPLQVLTDLSTDELKLHDGAKALEGTFERQDLAVSLLSSADAVMPGQTVSAHTEQMEQAVQMLVRALGNTLDLAQNVVNPTIDRVVKKVTEHIDETMAKSLNVLNIVQQRPDPIFDSIYLQEATDRYSRSLSSVPLRSFGLPAGDIAELLKTGHAGMDEQLEAFLGRVGVDYAASVWSDLFGSAAANTSDVFGRPSQATAAVLAFFYAAKINLEIPAGLNVELSDWRAHTSAVMAAAGAAIVNFRNVREQQRRYGPLVLSCPHEAEPVGDIVVDGDKYTAWLGAGGSPELIFATAYGDKKFDAVRMIENAEKLKDSWSKIHAMYQNKLAYVRFDAMVSGLKAAMTAEINSTEGVDTEACHVRLREILPRIKQRGLQELWHSVRKVVCRVLYPQTDVEALLLAIDDQAKLHEGKETRELALYATIELTARWLADQVVATYHN